MPKAQEGESTRGGTSPLTRGGISPLSLGGFGGLPRDFLNFERRVRCAFLMGFCAFGTRF